MPQPAAGAAPPNAAPALQGPGASDNPALPLCNPSDALTQASCRPLLPYKLTDETAPLGPDQTVVQEPEEGDLAWEPRARRDDSKKGTFLQKQWWQHTIFVAYFAKRSA